MLFLLLFTIQNPKTKFNLPFKKIIYISVEKKKEETIAEGHTKNEYYFYLIFCNIFLIIIK